PLLVLRAAPSSSTLFPYTTLFRSADGPHTQRHHPRGDAALHVAAEDRIHMGILHAALGDHPRPAAVPLLVRLEEELHRPGQGLPDRKSTRLNSSHVSISYAVFCLK